MGEFDSITERRMTADNHPGGRALFASPIQRAISQFVRNSQLRSAQACRMASRYIFSFSVSSFSCVPICALTFATVLLARGFIAPESPVRGTGTDIDNRLSVSRKSIGGIGACPEESLHPADLIHRLSCF